MKKSNFFVISFKSNGVNDKPERELLSYLPISLSTQIFFEGRPLTIGIVD